MLRFSGRFDTSGSILPLSVPEISPCDGFCDGRAGRGGIGYSSSWVGAAAGADKGILGVGRELIPMLDWFRHLATYLLFDSLLSFYSRLPSA